ncbi:MAG: peptidase and in, kexin, sedolisin, partial [Candidatus Solibacter sp.]|nr:peptidase and in, kexin, sedolisin [Candidatus Solibacter sp.]
MSKRLALFLCVAAILPAAQDRIAAPVDRTRTVRIAGHVHPRALPDADRGAVDPAMPIDHATVLLRPDSSLSLFLAAQQMPGSPEYRRFLSPEQFGERFGLSANDMAKVVSWLESQGLHIDEIARGRHWITFSGTAAQAARTFRTEFHRFADNGRTRFANTSEPAIPAALESVVAGFSGLNDFPTHVPRPLPQTNLSDGSHAIAPDDLATIYNITPLYAAGIDGTGQKIAIAGEVNLNLADIRSFRKTFGLPANDPDVILTGRDPGPNPDALAEADLDVEWAGAVARNAKVVYVYSSDAFTAARYAIDQKLAPVLSVSFGACEALGSQHFRAVAQQANAQGITFLVASGDWGAATCDHASPVQQAAKGARASFPAGIPEVTAVGGTMFNEGSSRYWAGVNSSTNGSVLSYIPEVAWNETILRGEFAASGGGPSAYFPKPFWQAGPGVPDDGMRDTPDISLTSSIDHDSYVVVSGGSLVLVGGTSAASPSLAGIVALLNQSLVSRKLIDQPGLGNINPTLYRLAQSAKDAFHDITSGDNFVPCVQGTIDCSNGNLGYQAAPGYDMATGLGSIDAARLIAAWNTGDASTTTLAADITTAVVNDTVKLTATVKGAGASPTGAVTFVTILDVALGSAPLTAAGDTSTAALSVSAQSVLAGDGKVYALYSGDGTYASSVGSVTLTATPASPASLVFVTLSPNPTSTLAINGQAPVTIIFSEKAGVATRLTSATVGNSSINLNTFFGGGAIPANGTLTSATLGITPSFVPADFVFHFVGQDADGTTWTRDAALHVSASPGPGLVPGIALSTSSSPVAQNPQGDPACQWSHQLTVRETGGYYVTLSDPGNGVQQLFGTTRLAPFGSLTGNVCATSIGSKTYQFSGLTEIGTAVSTTLAVSYTAAITTPTAL